jgi:ankyrin repeat protein
VWRKKLVSQGPKMSSQLGTEIYQDYLSILTWNNNVEPAEDWATREPGGGQIIGQNETYFAPESCMTLSNPHTSWPCTCLQGSGKIDFAQIPNSITQSTEPVNKKKVLTRQHQYQNNNAPSTDSNGATVLHLAVQSVHLSILRLLLETSLDIDSKNEEGQSALHLATLRGSRDTIQLLLENGANTDLVDIRGQTALHLAAERGDTAVIRLLIESTSPDSRDFLGRTAFHLAVQKGHEEIVRLMLDRGADIHAKVQ